MTLRRELPAALKGLLRADAKATRDVIPRTAQDRGADGALVTRAIDGTCLERGPASGHGIGELVLEPEVQAWRGVAGVPTSTSVSTGMLWITEQVPRWLVIGATQQVELHGVGLLPGITFDYLDVAGDDHPGIRVDDAVYVDAETYTLTVAVEPTALALDGGPVAYSGAASGIRGGLYDLVIAEIESQAPRALTAGDDVEVTVTGRYLVPGMGWEYRDPAGAAANPDVVVAGVTYVDDETYTLDVSVAGSAEELTGGALASTAPTALGLNIYDVVEAPLEALLLATAEEADGDRRLYGYTYAGQLVGLVHADGPWPKPVDGWSSGGARISVIVHDPGDYVGDQTIIGSVRGDGGGLLRGYFNVWDWRAATDHHWDCELDASNRFNLAGPVFYGGRLWWMEHEDGFLSLSSYRYRLYSALPDLSDLTLVFSGSLTSSVGRRMWSDLWIVPGDPGHAVFCYAGTSAAPNRALGIKLDGSGTVGGSLGTYSGPDRWIPTSSFLDQTPAPTAPGGSTFFRVLNTDTHTKRVGATSIVTISPFLVSESVTLSDTAVSPRNSIQRPAGDWLAFFCVGPSPHNTDRSRSIHGTAGSSLAPLVLLEDTADHLSELRWALIPIA